MEERKSWLSKSRVELVRAMPSDNDLGENQSDGEVKVKG